MTEENANNNVNQSLQLTPEEKAYLAKAAEQAKLAEAEAAKNTKRQEWLNQVKAAAGATWDQIAAVKNPENGKTILEVFNESPQLLDNPASTQMTLDLFKSYGKSNGVSQSVQDQGASPNNPGGGLNGGARIESYGELETLFADIKAGKVKKEEIVNSKLKDSDKVLLLQLQVSSSITSTEHQKAVNKFL